MTLDLPLLPFYFFNKFAIIAFLCREAFPHNQYVIIRGQGGGSLGTSLFLWLLMKIKKEI